MNTFFALLFVPVIWATIGLVRGRMPISNLRELKPPYLRRFAIGFIVAPFAIALICAATILVAIGLFKFDREDTNPTLFMGIVALPALLALLLSRAKRFPVKLQHQKFRFHRISKQLRSLISQILISMNRSVAN